MVGVLRKHFEIDENMDDEKNVASNFGEYEVSVGNYAQNPIETQEKDADANKTFQKGSLTEFGLPI